LCVHGLAALIEPAQMWMWAIGPLTLYLIERILRIIRGKEKSIIVKAIQHPSRVLEIRMKKAVFNYSPGQFVFLCCSYIADFEWHPFTISSSPEDDYLSVHIRIVGDWTGKLHKLLNPENIEGVCQENMHSAPNGKPILEIDGPFGTASEDVWKFQTIMLWAAGIGATPFSSILKAIKNKIESGNCELKRVEFYWTNRDVQSFEWFIDLLSSLEKSCPFLEINLFFTGNLNADQVRTYMQGMNNNDEDNIQVDAITGLNARTTFGRPDISAIYAQKAQQFQGQTVGVFFCGPPVMSKELLRNCEEQTSVANNTRFVYHKENF